MPTTYECQEGLGILNFRDLGSSTANNQQNKQYVQQGRIFRSATLDGMNNDQVDDLIRQHQIKTIIDLRTSQEGKKGLPIDKNFPTSALKSLKSASLTHNDVHQDAVPQVVRKKYRVDFAGKNFQRKCIFPQCPLSIKLYVILLVALGQRQKAATVVREKVMSKMGVGEMYKQFAIYCQHEIKSILHIFENPDHYPIQIHCTQGKDRTGIVSALLLSIAGVPKDLIIQDYAKTRKGLAPVYSGMLQDIRQSGLTDDFAHTTPEDMRKWLDFLDQEYGSVQNYLDTIGINKQEQKRIRENMNKEN